MANRDPARPPRHWAPEVHRLRCALYDAMTRLPYASADARLLDGVHKWLGWRGRGMPCPSPAWTATCALVTATVACLDDADSRALLAPWVTGRGHAPAEAGAGFRPLGG